MACMGLIKRSRSLRIMSCGCSGAETLIAVKTLRRKISPFASWTKWNVPKLSGEINLDRANELRAFVLVARFNSFSCGFSLFTDAFCRCQQLIEPGTFRGGE